METVRAVLPQVQLFDEAAVDEFRAGLRGELLRPQDAGYDEVRTVWNAMIDRRPALIARCTSAVDVISAVNFARAQGMSVSVRGGGHNVAGNAVCDGGLMIDLLPMKGIRVDPVQRTARVEPGVIWSELDRETQAFGLATTGGTVSHTGVAGLTLGGGLGWLLSKHGLACDNLLSVDVVTADGELLMASETENPDLFWAIRGGGGNFGVVTRLQYKLHEVGTLVGGMLILPASPDLLQAFVAAAEAAPEELTTIANVMVAPPMPFLPPAVHGKLILMAQLVCACDVEAGERAVAPFRALATPLADMVRPMPYPQIYPPEDDSYHPMGAARNLFLDALGPREAGLIFDHIAASTAMMAVTQVRVLGGAISRVPDDATAFAHRRRRIMVNVAALYGYPEESAVHDAWAAGFAAALTGGTTGAYVNFVGNEGAARVREAYPGATWDRLAAIKARYDPANLFRLNQNILPATESAA